VDEKSQSWLKWVDVMSLWQVIFLYDGVDTKSLDVLTGV
jgi:hypothetical protein